MPRQRPPKLKIDVFVQRVNEIILKLVKTEEYIKGSTQPYNITDNEELKFLDALARLLTGDEVCAAVCYENDKLLIASNRQSPEYAKKYLAVLKSYLEEPFSDQYNELIKIAQEQISYIIDQKLNNRLLKLLESYDNKPYVDFGKAVQIKNFDKILSIGEEIIIKKRDDPNKDTVIDILRPIIDTRIVSNAFESTNNLSDKLKHAIRNDNIEYLQGLIQLHAEMKILDKVAAIISIIRYLGISKLACWPCDAVLEMFNQQTNAEFLFSGTHGGTYEGWLPPEWIKNNHIIDSFLDKLQKEKGQHPKWKEYIPYTDPFLPAEPILSKFKNLEEIRARINLLKSSL